MTEPIVVTRPTLAEIEDAAIRIRSAVIHTPLIPLSPLAEDEPAILLKPETLQPVHSFKLRGVFNAVACLDPDRRARGVSTVSAGNTAQALAWTASRFGVTARSVMPDTAPRSKIDAVRRLGGEPVLVPVDELFRFLREHGWEREPYAFVHPWTNRDLLTGHASLGLEIVADCPDVDTVLVPVGGGGLIGGVGSALQALRPGVRVVAVEPEGCPALQASLAAGRPVQVACRTICDGVAVPYITEEMYPLLSEVVDEVVLVAERKVEAAVRRLALSGKLVVEPAGALALAAALDMPRDRLGRSVCLVTGGSIDRERLTAILGDAGP